eukprot:359498-Chlamydomonas_euryale.AAC.4
MARMPVGGQYHYSQPSAEDSARQMLRWPWFAPEALRADFECGSYPTDTLCADEKQPDLTGRPGCTT